MTDATDLPLAVAWARGTGATAIKLYADLTSQLAARITDEAHRQHLRVWAHATLSRQASSRTWWCWRRIRWPTS
ncbi:MAG TPA: hypothetical protein VGF31_01500 [Myxococcaceae bacterium]